uniref:DNAJC9 HTH domain-containing protein n=1 Tax=Guillardia theta TaxID=55529 RepID=A0A7S4NZM3_GUITH|mmetsp:Transcript_38853/g.122440  ORF Transcript_38853/g.122440 Transcript_38853/m.122440 type:complete len:178 (+) Transcript_38853:412-945(+)
MVPDNSKFGSNRIKLRSCAETGVVPGDGCFDGLQGKSFAELYEYYRAIYQPVTEEEYQSWEKKYPGSEEEKQDVAAFYKKKAGNMSRVCDYIPFCEEEDCWRIKTIIDEMIQKGELEETAAYKKFKPKQYSEEEVKKIKSERAPEEGWEEAKDELESKKRNSMDDLAALILAKRRYY